ncbi:MAG: NAD-dependent epimerase/dehydratase family protein [candidate division WOR-3 bacterium]
MRVFLTGATGFIGRAVAKRLIELGHEVTTLVRNPRKIALLPQGARVFSGDLMDANGLRKPLSFSDALVHCAAIVDYGSYPADAIYSVNVGGTVRLLETAMEVGIQRVVYVGSIAAYGTGRPGEPIRDESSLERRPQRFISHYERSKYLTLVAIKRRFPETVCIMPGVVYGPGAQIDPLLRLVAKGRLVFFIGSDNRLPFVHVADTAEGIAIGLERAEPGEYLCVSDVISMRELGIILARLCGRRPPIFVGSGALRLLAGPGPMFLKAFGVNLVLNPCSIRMALGDWALCSDRLRELGWKPIPISEGLRYLRGL